MLLFRINMSLSYLLFDVWDLTKSCCHLDVKRCLNDIKVYWCVVGYSEWSWNGLSTLFFSLHSIRPLWQLFITEELGDETKQNQIEAAFLATKAKQEATMNIFSIHIYEAQQQNRVAKNNSLLSLGQRELVLHVYGKFNNIDVCDGANGSTKEKSGMEIWRILL